MCKGGCGGIWFDWLELQKVDKPHESAGESLLDIEKAAEITVDCDQQRMCPKCTNTVMMQHFYGVKKEVIVDECAKCGGFWLDYGELGQIRRQYVSDEERVSAEEEYFSHIDKKIALMQKESEEKAEKAKKIVRIFRFICPSYYIPGKQAWGAF